jgi:transcriptional regulator with XRE-family HTH domain
MSLLEGGQTLACASGARMAEFRKQLGMTQVRLAAETGLSRGMISQIECGRAVSLDDLRTYVAGLGGRVEVVVRIGNVWLNVG